MALLTIVANFRAQPETVDLVRTELGKLLPVSRKENGCIQYDLHEDLKDAGHFLLYETWESRALWEHHVKAPHIAAFLKATKDTELKITIYEMKHVD